jgi:hypothetical protein
LLGFDVLAAVPVDVLVEGPSGYVSTPVTIPPPGITYSVTIEINLSAKTISWKGEHDGFPAHEFFVEHELEHGYLPNGLGPLNQLTLFPVFPSVKFEGSTSYK